MFGIYVHIPFCLQQCRYCDFATVTRNQDSEKDTYVDLLCREILSGAPLVEHKSLTSLYFGGGTPSLLSLRQFEKIFNTVVNAGFSFSR